MESSKKKMKKIKESGVDRDGEVEQMTEWNATRVEGKGTQVRSQEGSEGCADLFPRPGTLGRSCAVTFVT